MPRVFIPPFLKELTSGVSEVDIDATSVRAVIDQLDERFPGVRERLCQDDALRPGLCVSVDGRIAGLGLYHRVTPQTEIHFIPAIGGG